MLLYLWVYSLLSFVLFTLLRVSLFIVSGSAKSKQTKKFETTKFEKSSRKEVSEATFRIYKESFFRVVFQVYQF